MAGQISESYQSRQFKIGLTSGRDLIYTIWNTCDEDEVYDLILSLAPLTFGGLRRNTISAEPVGGNVWTGKAEYEFLTNQNEYNFETGGATQKITQSLHTTIFDMYDEETDTGTGPDFHGAIGVDDKTVEGVDIVVPQFEFSETWYMTDAQITSDYKKALFNATGKINDAPFRDFDTNEVLFMGATGNQKAQDLWVLVFKFACSPNATDLYVDEIGPIDKKGWDFLWIRYEDKEDDDAHELVKRPMAVYCEQVYYEVDFNTLMIPDTPLKKSWKMPDPYRSYQTGDPLPNDAETLNAFSTAGRFTRDQKRQFHSELGSIPQQTARVRVKNTTGAAQSRFAILGLDQPIFLPSVSVDAFKREICFKAVVPTSAHKTKFCVLEAPLDKEAIGYAHVSSLIQCQVNVTNSIHTCCDITVGTTGNLTTVSSGGSAEMVWRETGTGVLWAIVRLGNACT